MFFHDMKMLERVFWLKRIKGSGNPMHEATSTSGSFVTDVVAPLKKLLLNLSPIQDLHGYDKPWSEGAGKNKFDIENVLFTGVRQASLDDYGSYKQDEKIYNGGTQGITAGSGITIPVSEGDYTISATVGGEACGASFYAVTLNGQTWSSYVGIGNASFPIGARTSYTVTVPSGYTHLVCAWYSATQYASYETDIQIEAGSSATSWTPYSNICPISGHTEVDTEACGVNVWDEEWRSGYYTPNGDFSTNDACVANVNHIKVAPNQTYYFSLASRYSSGARLVFRDASENLISVTTLSAKGTFATPSNCEWLDFGTFGASGVSSYQNDISINYPSTDTDYHAYDGHTYTTTLGRTVYGGTLDVVSGELVVDRAMVTLDGSESGWAWYDELLQAYIALPSVAKYFIDQVTYTCNALTPIPNQARSNNIGNFATLVTSGSSVALSAPNCNTLNEFKTWASSNPIQFCYEPATPQTYQLTPQQINSLVGQNNIITEDGVEVSEVVYLTRLVGSPLLGSPQTEEPTEETNEEPVEESEEPEGE